MGGKEEGLGTQRMEVERGGVHAGGGVYTEGG